MIPVEIFKASLTGHEQNHFVTFLLELFGAEITSQLVSQYFIGTSKHWEGATVFWQVDSIGQIRTGKIMQYSPSTGKRVKIPHSHITWVHKALKMPDFALRQCFFGEHLLNATENRKKPVAIVESEKTAIIASVYLPQFVWLASGSLSNLNADKCNVLKGKAVVLYPDINGYALWHKKAEELSHIAKFSISALLERKSTEAERKQGMDLADYLVRYPIKEFQLQKSKSPIQNAWELKPPPNKFPVYVCKSGTLLIPTPPRCNSTYTVYSSIEAYNNRSETPKIIPMHQTNTEGAIQVFIDLNTLKVNSN